MPATTTSHYFFEAKPRMVGKVGSGGVASTSSTTVPHTFVGLTNGNAYVVTANRTDATGTTKNAAADTETFIGVVSGTNFINCVRAVEGSAQAWAVDTVLEVLMTATTWNKLITGLEVTLNSDGTLKSQTNLGLTTPKITTSINDANGNEVIKTPATTSAVNEITVTNAATGNAPSIAATGGDTNIDLNLISKGTGAVKVNGSYILGTDGWASSTDTWTYASASTFTISGVDRTSTYTKGTRLRFKQGGGYKYAVVVASSFSTNTTVTILVNSDHTIANSSITDNGYSYIPSPQGYPSYFNVSTTITAQTAFTNSPTTNYARLAVNGNQATAMYKWTYHGTSGGAGQTRATLPITPAADSVGYGAEVTNQITVAVGVSSANTRIEVQKYDGTTIISNSVGVAVNATFEF